jgi:hypothetical protein
MLHLYRAPSGDVKKLDMAPEYRYNPKCECIICEDMNMKPSWGGGGGGGRKIKLLKTKKFSNTVKISKRI